MDIVLHENQVLIVLLHYYDALASALLLLHELRDDLAAGQVLKEVDDEEWDAKGKTYIFAKVFLSQADDIRALVELLYPLEQVTETVPLFHIASIPRSRIAFLSLSISWG